MRNLSTIIAMLLLLSLLCLIVVEANATPFKSNQAKVKWKKYMTTTLTLLPTDSGCSNTIAISGNYLYIGTNFPEGVPGYVVKIDLTTFTRTAGLLVADSCNAILINGGFLYAGQGLAPGNISKINLSTFTLTSTLTLGIGEDNVMSLAVSGGFLYAGVNNKVVKIDLATFTSSATLTFAPSAYASQSMVVVGNYLYVLGDRIWKVDLATFTVTASIPIPETSKRAMATDGTYLYASVDSVTATRIIKVDLATFSEVASLYFLNGVHTSLMVGIDGKGLFAGAFRAVDRIDLSTFKVQSTIDVPDFAVALVMNSNYDVYAGMPGPPTWIARIHFQNTVTTQTETSPLITDTGEGARVQTVRHITTIEPWIA